MLVGKVSVISLPVRSCSFEDISFTLILELKSILDHPRYCPALICANSREKSFEGREDSFFGGSFSQLLASPLLVSKVPKVVGNTWHKHKG